jgi:hypothetical protein
MWVRAALVAGALSLSCACSGSTIGRLANADPAQGADAGSEAEAGSADARATPTRLSDGAILVKPRVGPDAGICAALDVRAEGLPVDAYLMVDLSPDLAATIPGSSTTWWDAVRQGIAAFATDPAASHYALGLQFFPLNGTPTTCQADYATPDVEIATLPENASNIEQSLAAHAPLVGAGRPTGPALAGAHAHVVPRTLPGHALSVGLITMGSPTECEPMSVAGLTAMADMAKNGTPRVWTTVIPLGAAPPDLARVGGGDPRLLSIPGGDVTKAVRAALFRVIQPPPPPEACAYDLPVLEYRYVLDLERTEVTISSFISGHERVPRVDSAADCDRTDGRGWYYDGADSRPTIQLCYRSCADGSSAVGIRFGCYERLTP